VAGRGYAMCQKDLVINTDKSIDALLEASDEEVLGYSSESEDEDEDEDEVEDDDVHKKSGAMESSDEEAEIEEEEDAGGWGSSRKDYYGNDQIETQEDAEMEEAELKRLQQKKLQKMSDADFGFDENEWLDAGNDEDEGDVVTEVLKDIEITPEMGPDERLRILHSRYPEFEYLANEFVQLQPVLQTLQKEAESEKPSSNSALPPASPTVIKCRALAAYIAALTMYFAILTSPAKGNIVQARALDPAELRDHAVMDSLLQCRETWSKVKSLKAPAPLEISSEDDSIVDAEIPHVNGKLNTLENETSKPSKQTKKEGAREAAAAQATAHRAEQIRLVEEELADLDTLIPKSRKSAKKSIKPAIIADDDSDFGEEETMDAKAAAEKAQKKKSLRFYTSQIAQKANKRAGAGRDAGGDVDVPYRERLKDRQARLNAEAEKRGKKLDEYGRGADLGGDSGDEDEAAANEVRDEEDDYYDMVAKTSKKRKQDRDEKYGAIAKAKAEGKLVRVVEGEVGEDGKRAIGYVIEKNKGLAPKRKKDVRNPRVKKRKKFEEKKKKLSSTKAVYKGGEERGGYGGEKTGIKSGLIKSIKL
jgi:U3 small nucleolar RNA-associated protein 3